MTATITQPSRSGRFIAGDAIRGWACAGVVFWHVAVAYGIRFNRGDPELGLGWIGGPIYAMGIWIVWLFFVLSGYLIGGPFVRAVVRGDGRVPRIGAYARNRVLRIVPAFWFFVTLTVLLRGTEGSSPGEMLLFYGFGHLYDQGPFVHRMIQAWTLDVEVVFYLFTPLLLIPVAKLLRGRFTPQARAAILLAGLAVIALASLSLGTRGPASGRSVPGAMWCFVPGLALATIEPLVAPRLKGAPIGMWLARLLLVAPLGLFTIYYWVLDGRKVQNAVGAVAIGCVIAAPLVLQWTNGRSWAWLDNRAIRWIGINAYGIYLVHLLVIQQLRPWAEELGSSAKALLITAPPAFAISAVIGWLSFRFIETPFLERRVPWRAAEPQPSAGPGAVAASEAKPQPAGS